MFEQEFRFSSSTILLKKVISESDDITKWKNESGLYFPIICLSRLKIGNLIYF